MNTEGAGEARLEVALAQVTDLTARKSWTLSTIERHGVLA